MNEQDKYLDHHFIHRSNWLRAAVLGANDGIISIASLAIGIAAASTTREPIVLATIAGLVAGALSMAAGEYVSVSSQTDIEKADIKREKEELEEIPETELQRLAEIYEKRGLKRETSLLVAKELTAVDALAAHVRDELGINEVNQAKPIQAAIASGAAFLGGGIVPLFGALFLPIPNLEYYLYGLSILLLSILGAIAAKTGGSSVSILAMTSGEEAEEVVEKLAGVSETYIESHEEAAETFALLSYILGGISLFGLWASFTKKSFANIVSIVTIIFALITLFFAQKTGTTGGEIRHTEIREEVAPFSPSKLNKGEIEVMMTKILSMRAF